MAPPKICLSFLKDDDENYNLFRELHKGEETNAVIRRLMWENVNGAELDIPLIKNILRKSAKERKRFIATIIEDEEMRNVLAL